MAGEGGLTYVLDANIGPRLLELLRLARMAPVGRITSLSELGFDPETPDEQWMPALGALGRHVAVTHDGEILRASVRLDAWTASGITLMILDGRWGQLPLAEKARAFFYWWPHMVAQAEAAKPGTAWTVPHRLPPPEKGIRLVKPQLGTPRAQAIKLVELSAPRRARGRKAL